MASNGRPAQGYELVMAVSLASFVVHNMYMPYHVMKARKKYGIEYPDLYASKDNCKSDEDIKNFNCVQRGHQNSLETQSPFLVLLNLAGLQNPLTAAAAGTLYLVGRIVYFHGYGSGKPESRTMGFPLYGPALITIMGIVGKTVYLWAACKKK